MAIRVRAPEEVRLDLPDGDWLLVKKHLNTGEERRAVARPILKTIAGQAPEINYELAGLTYPLEYLLDWSIQGAEGKPLVIRDRSTDVKLAALRALDPEDAAVIIKAIDDHHTAVTAAREAEKNAKAGETTSSATSASAA